jgi:hypothetical protein
MAWLKLDDQITHHVKFLRVGPAASWLWVCCLAHCQRQLTDGFIPTEVCHLLGVPEWKREIKRLIEANLVHAVAGGYQVHDYLDHNSSRTEILTRRAQDSARKGSGPSARIPTGSLSPLPDGIRTESEASRAGDARASHPIPSVPIPSVPAPSARARGGREAKNGHRQHVFCGARFCVPQFLAEEHRQQLGHLATSVDLPAHYRTWDRELGDEPVRSPKGYLATQIAGLIRRVGPVARTSVDPGPPPSDVWSDVLAVLAARLTRYELSTWFAGTRLRKASSRRLVVAIENQAKVDWIQRHYADALAAAVTAVQPGAKVVFEAERTET